MSKSVALFALIATLLASVAPIHGIARATPFGATVAAEKQPAVQPYFGMFEPGTQVAHDPEGAIEPDSVIVRFRDEVRPGTAGRARAHQRSGGRAARGLRFARGFEVVEVPPGTSSMELVERYASDPDVLYAEPNGEVYLALAPDDTHFARQWGLRNDGQHGGTPGADIGILEAWQATRGSDRVVVAVIDTGVDYTHLDLAPRMWEGLGYDFHDDSDDPIDVNGHGTHVASIIAAAADDGFGIAGVAPEVSIMAIKAFGASGRGTLDALVDSVAYADTMGADIVNASWVTSTPYESLREVISTTSMLVVAAAGNSGSNSNMVPRYPASWNEGNIIAVAATDRFDRLAAFSNYGSDVIDIAAPGVDILGAVPGREMVVLHDAFSGISAPFASDTSADAGGGAGVRQNALIDDVRATSSTTAEPSNAHEYKSGTSMAAPHVAGVAALLLSAAPGMSASELKDAITESATLLPSLSGKIVTGGRLDAGAVFRAPDIEALASPSHGESGEWSSESDVVFMWNEAEHVTGLAGYVFELSSDSAAEPDGVITASTVAEFAETPDGEWHFSVRALTDLGLWGPIARAMVRIDTVPPESTVTFEPFVPDGPDGWYNTTPRITITANDMGSGVAYSEWRFEGQSVWKRGSEVGGFGNGEHTLHFRSVDGAGNVEAQQSVEFKVDVVPATVGRLWGPNRYVTAVVAARQAYPDFAGIEHLVVASGEDRAAADPLAAAGLAGVLDAPILLVHSGGIPDAVRSMIASMPQDVKVVIVGGTAAVPSHVEHELSQLPRVSDVERAAGTDRYATARVVSDRMAAELKSRGEQMPATALLANGADAHSFFDALALSAVSSRNHFPVLLLERDGIPSSTSAALRDHRLTTRIVGGGEAVVSEGVRRKLGAERWAGADRYATAAVIASSATAAGYSGYGTVAVAASVPDALTGGAVAGSRGGVLLLTQREQLTPVTASSIQANRDRITHVYLLGGAASVSEPVRSQVRSLLH